MVSGNLKGLVFMFMITINIDFMRQRYMKYKAKKIIEKRKLIKLGLPDFSKLPVGLRLQLLLALGPIYLD